MINIFFFYHFKGNSRAEAKWLLERAGPKSTITIWGQDILNDPQKEKLNSIIEELGRDRVYLDVCTDLLKFLS